MREGDDVREHIDSFFDVKDKLDEMEVTINDDRLSIMLVDSLSDSFENFRCAMESWDELPTPEDLKIKIMEEFQARMNKQEEEKVQSAMITKPAYKRGRDQSNNSVR